MAAPSLHVICGYAGGDVGDSNSPARQAIMRDPVWSAEPAADTPTTQTAPDRDGLRPVFRVTATVDAYVSIGNPPNANASPRYLQLASDGQRDYYAKPGDSLEWVTA